MRAFDEQELPQLGKQRFSRVERQRFDFEVDQEVSAGTAAGHFCWYDVALGENTEDPRKRFGIDQRFDTKDLTRPDVHVSGLRSQAGGRGARERYHDSSPCKMGLENRRVGRKNPNPYYTKIAYKRIILLTYASFGKILTMLDAVEKRILTVLQEDATLSLAEIAERVGMSATPCWRRIQRLRQAGIIKAQVALLDRRAIGLNAQIFAQVRLSAQGRERLEEFSREIQNFPEVLECYVMMGSIDFMLRIVAADIDAYERFFFEKLSRVPGIQEISSMVALSEIKATTALPIP